MVKLKDLLVSAALCMVAMDEAIGNEGSLSLQEDITDAKIARSSHSGKTPAFSGTAAAVDPEYMKIETFSEFREKIIADGWVPVQNPECHDAVLGGSYESYCGKEPDSISCRVCEIVPEIFKSTSDGYSLMRYTKGGVPLSVTVYGDINDLDAPGRHGLVVVGWDYSESLNVMLIDD